MLISCLNWIISECFQNVFNVFSSWCFLADSDKERQKTCYFDNFFWSIQTFWSIKLTFHFILCLASYKPLYHYEWSGLLLITDEIRDVFTRQVTEPNQETSLKTVLPALDEITDEVSFKVKEQYEAHPYPRWVNLGLSLKPAPIFKVVDEVKLNLFDQKIKEVEFPNILVAGCGTGQHSIENPPQT